MLVYRVSFPDGGPNLCFDAESNAPGAAWCIDGHMNTRPDGTWVASLRSSGTAATTTTAAAGDGGGGGDDGGTRSTTGSVAGPTTTHCRWSLDPVNLLGGGGGGGAVATTTSRVQRVEQLLRTMIVK